MSRPGAARTPEAGPDAPADPGLRETALAALAYALASVLAFRPVHRVFRDHLAPDGGDPVFVLYVLDWVSKRLDEGLAGTMGAVWDAPFFHPAENVLLLSDWLPGPAVLFDALAPLVGGPVAAYNGLFVGTFAVAALATHWTLRRAGLGVAAAVLGALAFAFSPFRLSHASHLAILLGALVPLVLWSFDRLLARPSRPAAIGFLVTYGLHASGGAYLAAMVHIPLAVLLANRLLACRERRRRLVAPDALLVLVPTGVAAASLGAGFLLPYRLDGPAGMLGRTTHEMTRFGATLPAWLTPSRWNLHEVVLGPRLDAFLASLHAEPGAWLLERSLFPGLLPGLLAVVGLGWFLARHRRESRPLPWLARRGPVGRAAGRALPWIVAGLLAAAGLSQLVAHDLHVRGVGSLHPHTGDRLAALVAGVALALVALRLLRGAWPVGFAAPGDTGPIDTRPGDTAPIDTAPIDTGADDPDRHALWWRGLALATLATALLSFPLVFLPAAEVVPGLGSLRAPARFHALTTFGLATLAAYGLERLLRWLGHRNDRRTGRRLAAATAVLLVALTAVELTPRRLPWLEVAPTPAEFPPVYRQLAARDEPGAVLLLPFGDIADEVRHLWLSTAWIPEDGPVGKPIVNGYSGHFPTPYEMLRHRCCWPAPDGATLTMLRRWEVGWILVETDRFPRPWQHRAFAAFRARAPELGVREVWSDEKSVLFRIDPEPPARALSPMAQNHELSPVDPRTIPVPPPRNRPQEAP